MVDILATLMTDEGLFLLAVYGLACAFAGFLFGEQNERNKG